MHTGPRTGSVWILVSLIAGSAFAEPWPAARISQSASPETRSLLRRADRFVASGEWEVGVNALRLAMDAHGNERIGLDRESAREPSADQPQLLVTVRQYCHLRLTAWAATAPQALATYRRQVDRLVNQRLQIALASHDWRGLNEIARQFFTSSHADQALWHLGEWALERGNYNQARWAWERLHPALRHRPANKTAIRGTSLWLALHNRVPDAVHPGPPPHPVPPTPGAWPLAYPDTDYTLADIRARLVLVSLLEGSFRRAETEHNLYRQLHARAEGKIGGREGLMVDLLQDLLQRSRTWPESQPTRGWPTFAGNQSRSWTAAQAIDLELRPVWTVQLAPTPPLANRNKQAQPPYFPVVAGNLVVTHDTQRIQAFNLKTGEPAFPSDNNGPEKLSAVLYEGDQIAVEDQIPLPAGPRHFTPMLYGQQVFASLGSSTNHATHPNPDTQSPNQLVGLDLAAEGRLKRGFPLSPPDSGWAWDGTPVCDGNRLHIPLRKQTDAQFEAALGRYDLTTARPLGPLVRVASSIRLDTPANEYRPYSVLSLTNECLLYNTNLGAIAAFDTEQGSLKWVFRYPRSARSAAAPQHRAYRPGPNPCLIYRDLAIVAPADSQRMLALDITTGQLIWSARLDDGMRVLHLLGIAAERIIACGDATYAFDLYSGRRLARFPSASESSVRGYGRGLLAGNRIYWPTHRAIFVLDTHSLSPVRQPIDLAQMGVQAGNLVLVDHTLLIAGPQRMAAFQGSPIRASPPVIPASRRVTPTPETSENRF